MNQERVVYLNGKMVPDSEAVVSIHDEGFVHGDAVFDVTRTFHHKIFKLMEHTARLYESMRYLRIDPGITKEEMADLTQKTLEANLHLLGENDDYWVMQRVSRGMATKDGYKPTVVIECRPLPWERARYYQQGVEIITPSVRRTPPQSLSPRAKMHNYLNMVVADLEVKAQNPEAWAILLDTDGNLDEGTNSNIFVIKDGEVLTPRSQMVLGGVSRETIIELAQELNIGLHEMDIDLFDAYTADEAFVTTTSICMLPVASINGVRLGGGEIPGPVTDRLLKAFSGLVGLDIPGQYLAHMK